MKTVNRYKLKKTKKLLKKQVGKGLCGSKSNTSPELTTLDEEPKCAKPNLLATLITNLKLASQLLTVIEETINVTIKHYSSQDRQTNITRKNIADQEKVKKGTLETIQHSLITAYNICNIPFIASSDKHPIIMTKIDLLKDKFLALGGSFESMPITASGTTGSTRV
jgi:hypothetical protein